MCSPEREWRGFRDPAGRAAPVGGPHRENWPALLARSFDGEEGGLHIQHSLVGEVRGPEATQRLFIH